MTADRYCMSFTTGGLFLHEAVMLAKLYREFGDWRAVRKKVLEENLLQARTLTTQERIFREVVARLKTLGAEEVEFLIDETYQDRSYLMWIAICRRYRFIADFATEVLRERYISLKTDLSHEDFDSFFNRKCEWHSELDGIRPSTRGKLRQVLFRILREARLLTADGSILAAMLSPRLVALISQSHRPDLLLLPAFEADLMEVVS